MKKVAVFGGAFDPPQNGHFEVSVALCSCGYFDEVWVVPCGERGDKPKMSSGDIRVRLLEQMILSIPVEYQHMVKIKRRELEGPGRLIPSKILMRYFRDDNPEITFYMYVGGDLLEPKESLDGHNTIFHSWQHGKVLLEESRFVVGRRPGYLDPNSYIAANDEKYIVLDTEFCGASSTDVRELRQAGVEWKHLLSKIPHVVAQIEADNLYK